MNQTKPQYYGYRFPTEIISHAVWLYHRLCLSYRDVEDLLAVRGIIVFYEIIRSWCNKFGPAYARTIKKRRGSVFVSSICQVGYILVVPFSRTVGDMDLV